MSKPLFRAALGCASMLLSGAVYATAADSREKQEPATSAEVRKSEQELQRVKGKIDSLRGEIERQRGEKDELGGALETAEKQLAEAEAKLRHIRHDIAAQNERIRANQDQQVAAQARLAQQRAELARQVRAAYLLGNRARTQLWLSQDDTAQIGRVTAEYDYVNRSRVAQMAAVQAQIDQIAVLQAQLIDERSHLQALEEDQTEVLKSMEKSRADRRQTLAQIEKTLASSESELHQAEADEAQVKKLLESLREALASAPSDPVDNKSPFGQQRGKLPWPLRGPIIAEYGSPKAEGRLSWSGRWIGAKEGTPVHAIARGRVAYVGWLQRYGLIVILEHGGGYFTLYGHCSSSIPTTGEWVDAGQAIGAAGDTGGHDRSGVYLEIRKGSAAVDPRQWLTK